MTDTPKPTPAALAERRARLAERRAVFAERRAVFAERRAQERNAELPQDVRNMLKLKGMMG